MAKVRSIKEAEERYGLIDFATRHWADEGKWIKPLIVPEYFRPYWKVLDTDNPVRAISCNTDIHGPLQAVFAELRFYGLGPELKTYDGVFNIRFTRGAALPSTHAWGLAIDINAALNPLGQAWTTFTPQFIDCWKKHGWTWGGDFYGRKDPMHFSWAWE